MRRDCVLRSGFRGCGSRGGSVESCGVRDGDCGSIESGLLPPMMGSCMLISITVSVNDRSGVWIGMSLCLCVRCRLRGSFVEEKYCKSRSCICDVGGKGE